jgi:peptidoglycan-N-acetylglucosamine deacetylase
LELSWGKNSQTRIRARVARSGFLCFVFSIRTDWLQVGITSSFFAPCSSVLWFNLSLPFMHKYFLKIPWWVRKLYPHYIWKVPVDDKTVFLTFDDGPHPSITPWVLKELKKYGAKASFFCIGKNVVQFPGVYQQILAEGHATGNHTYSHLNGWKTKTAVYLDDISKADNIIDSDLFRPPYGRIKREQAKQLSIIINKNNVKVVMWDVLSADFDTSISPETCARIVLAGVEPGSVVVFHDSEKAFPNLQMALPVVLRELKNAGFSFGKL